MSWLWKHAAMFPYHALDQEASWSMRMERDIIFQCSLWGSQGNPRLVLIFQLWPHSEVSVSYGTAFPGGEHGSMASLIKTERMGPLEWQSSAPPNIHIAYVLAAEARDLEVIHQPGGGCASCQSLGGNRWQSTGHRWGGHIMSLPPFCWDGHSLSPGI